MLDHRLFDNEKQRERLQRNVIIAENVCRNHVGFCPSDAPFLSEIPVSLYKYSKPEYVSSLIQNGELRISILQEFQDSKHGPLTDSREGVLKEKFMLGNSIETLSTDMLVLCLSVHPIIEAVTKFFGETSAPDSYCASITRPDTFLLLVDELVRAKLQSVGLRPRATVAGRVYYCDFPDLRMGSCGCGLHPAFLKPFKEINPKDGKERFYLSECEYRICWDMETSSNGEKLKKALGKDSILISDLRLASLVKPISSSDFLDYEKPVSIPARIYSKKVHSDWVKQVKSRQLLPVIEVME